MKKKLFLALVMSVIFVLTLAFTVSAESVHNENTVDYSATVTLNDGTVLPLYDENKDALIWYLDSQGVLQSVKAQDSKVAYTAAKDNPTWLASVSVDSNGDGTFDIANNNIVVLNLMDDDITGAGANVKLTETFNRDNGKGQNLQYAYLRLDTTIIAGKAFANCQNLKYVNLESLTELTTIGSASKYNYGEIFYNCKSLFQNQILDLSKTKLTTFINGIRAGGNFYKVPMSGIKLPSTLETIDSNTFNNCASLVTISLGKNVKTIGDNAFGNTTSLKAIFYVGTEEELSASPMNNLFTDAEKISYANYKNLADKSGKYVVYNYSTCEAYNNGVHTLEATNNCVGTCSVCGDTVVKHNEDKNISVSFSYSDYTKAGTKAITCNNAGCGYNATEDAPALFKCLGYSMPENNADKIVIGYLVDKNAINEYKESTGKAFKYGVFAARYDVIADKDLIDADGNVINGAIGVEVSSEYVSFDLRITGFKTDNHKSAKLSMGAYVIDDGNISYLQVRTPEDTTKYTYTTYNDVASSNVITEAEMF